MMTRLKQQGTGYSRSTRSALLTLLAISVLGASLGSMLTGCDVSNPPVGTLHVSTSGLTANVSGVLYEISCEDGTTLSHYSPLEQEGLPGHIDANLAGEAFADWFTVLAPGTCTVTATAMEDPQTPADGCTVASQDVDILAGQTTEILLVIVCEAPPTGALDIITVVTDGPVIGGLTFDPSKFIVQCEEVTITVDADGGLGNLTYDFVFVSTPPNAVFTWSSNGNVLTFAAETPGAYEVTVTVTDESGTTTELTFPIHVSDNPDIEHCADTCCRLEDGHVFFGNELACRDAGGVPVPDEDCRVSLCCETAAGPMIVEAADCPDGAALPMDKCETTADVCCQRENGAVTFLPSAEACVAAGGVVVAETECTDEVCCKLDGPQIVPAVDCPVSQILSPELCETICCSIEDQPPQLLTISDCRAQSGVPIEMENCNVEQSYVWHADYTLDPNQSCRPEPFLVVPSSGANQLAVYDLTTLDPLPSTPFNTCVDPSRILMDANTDVYATCRRDGRVAKHTRDGVLLWMIHLPYCQGSRGVAMSGDGRLFAACSDPGVPVVYELDPATGAVLNSVNTHHRIYGLAVDADGLYVASMYEAYVTQVHLGGTLDMTLGWSVHQRVYGITVDQVGNVWLGGSTELRSLSTVDGSLTNTMPTTVTVGGQTSTPALYGVMVGLDGNIYAATMANFIEKYDPLSGTLSGIALDAAANGNRGLTLDSDDNVYSINLNSNSLTKTTPAGVSTGFGDAGGAPFLVNPYGYSGDMTGLTTTCMAGTTDIWYSTPLDSGSPTTEWLTIAWTATTPPGSAVALYYSVDGGATWLQATNGQALNVIAQTLQVKAILSATIAGNEPTIDDVTVTWQ